MEPNQRSLGAQGRVPHAGAKARTRDLPAHPAGTSHRPVLSPLLGEKPFVCWLKMGGWQPAGCYVCVAP